MIKVSCPICGRVMEGRSLAEWPQFPFCSPRCKTIDLGRWLDDASRSIANRVPVDEALGVPPEEGPDIP